jgi:predicted GIY-YIG superfamily endonuclease
MTETTTDKTHQGWYIYIAECTDNTYYTGVIQDITEVRNNADYVRNRKLKSIPWCRMVATKSTAMLMQTHIRNLPRPLKEYVIDNEMECEQVLNLSKKIASSSA